MSSFFHIEQIKVVFNESLNKLVIEELLKEYFNKYKDKTVTSFAYQLIQLLYHEYTLSLLKDVLK